MHVDAMTKKIVASKREKEPKAVMEIDPRGLIPPTAPPAPKSPLVVKTSSEAQYSRVETIDPGLAKVLLEANVRNRAVSMGHARSLARDMSAGKWRLTHQGLALDRDGRLVDGQHRLHAIVLSGCTVQMTVTYNVDPESFHAVDVGLQPRGIHQIVSLVRGTKYAASVVAGSKVLWHVLEKNRQEAIRNKFTESEVTDLLDVFEPDLVWSIERLGSINLLKQAAVAAAFAFVAPVAREESDLLIKTLRARTGMSLTQVAYWRALEREGIATTHGDRMSMFAMTLRALYHHIRGDDIKAISIRNSENIFAQPEYLHFRTRRMRAGLLV